jgi:hypothetical protein
MGGQSKLVKLLDHTIATQAKAGIVDVTEKLRGARVVLEGAGVLFRTMAELVGKRAVATTRGSHDPAISGPASSLLKQKAERRR